MSPSAALTADVAPANPGDVALLFACAALPFVLGFAVLVVLHIRRTRARTNPEAPDDHP